MLLTSLVKTLTCILFFCIYKFVTVYEILIETFAMCFPHQNQNNVKAAIDIIATYHF